MTVTVIREHDRTREILTVSKPINHKPVKNLTFLELFLRRFLVGFTSICGMVNLSYLMPLRRLPMSRLA